MLENESFRGFFLKTAFIIDYGVYKSKHIEMHLSQFIYFR